MQPLQKADMDDISPAEKTVIDSMIEKYGEMSYDEIREKSHDVHGVAQPEIILYHLRIWQWRLDLTRTIFHIWKSRLNFKICLADGFLVRHFEQRLS